MFKHLNDFSLDKLKFPLSILTCVPDIGLAVRVFRKWPGRPGFNQRLRKMVLDASLLNSQHYKVWIKGKVEQSRDGVAPSPTPGCSSYRKRSLRVTLDYGRQLYFTYYCYLFHFDRPRKLR